MGTTTSRPILHGIESALLQMAQFVDTIMRSVEQLITSLFTLCLPSNLYHEFRLDEDKQLRACDEQGMCYIPATRVKQHAEMKNKREERLRKRKLRAEWAAAGLDVNEMEKQEQAKKKKQMQQKNVDNGLVDEKRTVEAMLGPVAQAPPARPEAERETRAEKERGKLWIMGNMAPKKEEWPFALPVAPAVDVTEPRLPTRMDKRGALESVREASHTEQQREYAMQGHGGRIASSTSEHGDISYQIVATSRDTVEEHNNVELVKPKARRHRRTITPQGIIPSTAEAMVSALSASRIQAAAPRPTHKAQSASLPSNTPVAIPATESSKGPTISQPTLVQPTAQRLRRSLDILAMGQADNARESAAATRKDPIDIRTESPRFFNRARASLETANSIQAPSSTPPTSPPFSSAASDAGSIASRKSVFGASISRGSTPPVVMDLADRACKSRWEANAKERKVWKGEVNRIALEKLQQNSKRHHESLHARSVIGGDLRLQPTMSAASTSSNLAIEAEKRLRRATLQPSQVSKAGKIKRRSSQKA